MIEESEMSLRAPRGYKKSGKAFRQILDRIDLEAYGLVTWPIRRTRNETAKLLWIACARLNPEAPRKAYHALGQTLYRLETERKFRPIKHKPQKPKPPPAELTEEQRELTRMLHQHLLHRYLPDKY